MGLNTLKDCSKSSPSLFEETRYAPRKEINKYLKQAMSARSICSNSRIRSIERTFNTMILLFPEVLKNISFYYINTNEILGELSRENLISSHVKITCYLHMWKYHLCYGYILNRAFHTKKLLQLNGLVFHWCLYNKKNITWPLGDIPQRGHVISSISADKEVK